MRPYHSPDEDATLFLQQCCWYYIILPLAAVILFYAIYKFICWRRRYRVRGKIVLITGASSGIGKACAKVFYDNGAKVILASRNEASLRKVKEEIHDNSGPEPGIITINLSDYDSIRNATKALLKEFHHIDILINNAGQAFRGPAISADITVHEHIMKVNYFGQIVLTQELLPTMIKNGGGAIVAVSSIQGKVAISWRTAYGASKHALECYFDALRAEHYDDNIKVLICCPSYTKTPLPFKGLLSDGSEFGKMDEEVAAGMAPEYVAQEILKGVEYDKKHIILGPIPHVFSCYFGNIFWNMMAIVMRHKARRDKEKFALKNKSD